MNNINPKELKQIIDETRSREISNIENTFSELDIELLTLISEEISRARRVYIIGIRSCEPLAELLGFYLNMIRDNVFVVKTSSASEIFEQMIHMCSRDVCIGISFPRYSKRTLRALEYANSKNARVISITDSLHSPLCMYSSCNLISSSVGTDLIDSLTAPLSLINTLIAVLSHMHKNKIKNNLKNLENIWQVFQVYSIDELEYANIDEDENTEL